MVEFMRENSDIIIAILTLAGSLLGFLVIRARITLTKSQKELTESKKDIEALQGTQKHTSEQLVLIREMFTTSAAQAAQQSDALTARETAWQQTMATREQVWQQSIKDLAETFKAGLDSLIAEQQAQNSENQKTMHLVAQTTGNLAEVLRGQVSTMTRIEQQVTELSALSEKNYKEVRDLTFTTSENSDHLLKVMEAIRDRIVAVTNPDLLLEIKHLAERIYQKLESTHEKTLPLPIIDALLAGADNQSGAGTGSSGTSEAGLLPAPG